MLDVVIHVRLDSLSGIKLWGTWWQCTLMHINNIIIIPRTRKLSLFTLNSETFWQKVMLRIQSRVCWVSQVWSKVSFPIYPEFQEWVFSTRIPESQFSCPAHSWQERTTFYNNLFGLDWSYQTFPINIRSSGILDSRRIIMKENHLE